MKRYVRASKGSTKVTGRTWEEFLDNISNQTHFFPDNLEYSEGPQSSNYLLLYTNLEPNNQYVCQYTCHPDGTYELILESVIDYRDFKGQL